MPRTAVAVILAALAPPAALAQPAIIFEIDEPVLLPGESTTVTLFAGFDPDLYAMGMIQTDFLTSVGSEGWSDWALVPPMNGPGTARGEPTTIGFEGILAGQIHDALYPVYPDGSNPIAFWQATYTAPSDVIEPFEVEMGTLTSAYDVYIDRFSPWVTESELDDLVEGSGTINVIPVPASAFVFTVGVCALRRRR